MASNVSAMDELSPLFQDIEFHERFRGYDPDEVDAYVDRVAKAAALVQGRLSELQQRAEAAEARAAEGGGSTETEATLTRTLILAQRTADAAVAEAKEEAAFIVAGAETEAQASLRVAQAEASATTKEADEHASRVMAEAETDKRRILSDAEAMAMAAASSERDRLAAETAEFERYRGFLNDDVEILERHLLEQRNVLAASISILTDLLDQPESFRTVPAPATSGIQLDLIADSSPAPDQASITAPEEIAVEEVPTVDEVIEIEEVIAVDEVAAIVEEVPIEASVGADDEATLAHDEAIAEEVVTEEDLPLVEEVLPAVNLVDDVHEVDEIETASDLAPVSAWDEPVFAPDSLIDLTVAPVDSGFDGAPDGAGDEPGPDPELVPSPPLLITASDLDPAEVSVPTAAAVDPGPVTAPMPALDEASLFSEPAAHEQADPFLAQLREAVAGDDEVVLGDDALSAFFDQDEDDAERSWFGKRR